MPLRVVELIRKKRDGLALSAEELTELITAYTAGAVPDYQMAAFLMAAFLRGLDEAETTALTLAMARSGPTLDLSPLPGVKVDKHSTGGVGDKTTLVVVPLVAACGVPVVKLSGRALGHTGGTVDKLASIPGLRLDLSRDELVAVVRQAGCCIAGQSAELAPADKKLYALRDVTATVESIPLIAASVCSKKIAAGADGIVFDVKVGRGAFMATLAEARRLAQAMLAIMRRAGRRAVALVTAMDQPLGRTVGNALEVQEAMATLAGEGPADLLEVSLALAGEMLHLAGAVPSPQAGRERALQALRSGEGLARWRAMVAAQGGDPRVVEDPSRLPQAPRRVPLRAPADGVVTALDARQVGLAVAELGAGRDRQEDEPDLAVGVVLHRKMGEPVRAGEPLATLHAGADEARLEAALRRLEAAYELAPAGVAVEPPAGPVLDRLA